MDGQRTSIVTFYLARGLRGFGDGFAIIILPAYMTALGYDVWLHRYIALIIAGMFAGLAGALLVFQNGIASPGQLRVVWSTRQDPGV